MKIKVTNFLKDLCDIHGETDFYIYKGEPHKCAICTRKKSKEWKLENPKYVKEYSIKYRKENPDRIKYLNDIQREIIRRKKIQGQDDFYEKFGSYIEEIASKICLKKIPNIKRFKEINDPNKDKILEVLIKCKRSQLISYERYRASGMVKWNHLKSLNMKSATEEQKSIIRDEYKRIAQKIVDAEMERIIKIIK